MSKFRVKQPLSQLDTKQVIDLETFTDNAETHCTDKIDINARPTKSFTVPLNDYELGLLKQYAKRLDRSQRYVSRKLLVRILEKELNINT